MRFTPSKCPECGLDPKLILESLYAQTGLEPADANGDIEFDNYRGVEILWDSLAPAVVEGHVRLSCTRGHHWHATLEKRSAAPFMRRA